FAAGHVNPSNFPRSSRLVGYAPATRAAFISLFLRRLRLLGTRPSRRAGILPRPITPFVPSRFPCSNRTQVTVGPCLLPVSADCAILPHLCPAAAPTT